MKVKIYRYNEQTKEQPHFDEFDVAISKKNQPTITELLKRISREFDPSLGYFMHSACNRGVCKRCMIRLNGKPVLACRTIVPNVGNVILEPANKKKVIRDLVVKGL